MVLGVFLSLDQTVLFNTDFSDVSGLKITGTICSDKNKTSAFNITGYTVTLRLFKDGSRSDRLNQECTATVAASGTFYLSLTENKMPTDGIYLAKVTLAKSGTSVSSLNRVEVLIKRGP